jgi:hypothetical protein
MRDLDRAREGLIGFGVPEAWTQPIAIHLIVLELATAALLAFPPTRPAGALCALALLATFTLALLAQLLRGRRPACACFGALNQAPISWRSVGRNVLLMALALGVLAWPDAAAVPMLQEQLAPLDLLALILIALGALWLLHLTRQNGRLLLRIEQLERSAAAGAAAQPHVRQPLRVGDPAPALALSDARGRPFDLRALRGKPVLLLYLDTACAHCRALLAHLREAPLAGADAVFVVISAGDMRRDLPGEAIALVDPDWASAATFGVRGTPAAVLIDDAGAWAQAAVHGGSGVRAAIDRHIPAAREEGRHEFASV